MKTTHILLAAILAATSAIQSATAEHKLPAPLPQFKTPEQLAKWRQEMAAKAAATDALAVEQANSTLPISHSEAPSLFYTGKPYVEEIGSYAFKFRQYNPELSRWTTVDPSGFPDGANNAAYSAIPTCQLDCQGLATVTVTGVPQSGSSGSTLSIVVDQAAQQIGSNIQADMRLHWTIAGNPDGWVVQHVQFAYSAFNDADNSSYTLSSPPTSSYWEAWQVVGGTVQYGGNDYFRTNLFPESTHGTFSITGKVDFYRNSVVGSTSPSGWGSVPEAGILPATTSSPTWWTNSGFNHTLNMSWVE